MIKPSEIQNKARAVVVRDQQIEKRRFKSQMRQINSKLQKIS